MKHVLAAASVLGLLATLLPAAQDDAPKKIKPTNLGVNTKADEDDPHLAPDGLHLFYSSNPAAKEFHLMVSERRAKNQAWPEGKPLDVEDERLSQLRARPAGGGSPRP